MLSLITPGAGPASAITGGEPDRNPPMGYLDEFDEPILNRTLFEVVGYGTGVRNRKVDRRGRRPSCFLISAAATQHRLAKS